MRTAIAWLLLPLLLRAQDSRRAPEPADLLPFGAPIFAELLDPSGLAGSLRGADLFARALGPVAREELDLFLEDFAALGIRRAAFAYVPALVFADRWILVADAPDPAPIAAFLEKRIPPSKERPKPATGTIAPFAIVADSVATITAAEALRSGKGDPLTARDDFKRFRQRLRDGVAFVHLDAAKIAPRWLRFSVDDKDDVGAVLLAHHLIHTVKCGRTLSLALHHGASAGLDAIAEIDPIPPAHTFTETRPSAPFLTPNDDDVALCASMPRAFLEFWDARNVLLSEKARSPLAEFQNNASILLGGLSVEEFFAAIGSALDLYVGRGASSGRDGYRYPAAAVVGAVSDPAMKTNLLLTFQTSVGLANAQRSMDGQPRFFQESIVHRDVLVASARLLPETLADKDDERLQIEPTFAIAKDRIILGTNRAIVRALVDAALDGRTRPREAGDTIRLFGPQAALVVRDAAGFVRGRQALEKGRSPDEARKVVDLLSGLLDRTDGVRLQFDVEGDLATLTLRVAAPALLKPAPESR